MSIGTADSRQIAAEVFGDLPDALINELLVKTGEVSERALGHVDAQLRSRNELRQRAHRLGLIRQLPDLSESPSQSVAAVDGSAASIRLASFDLNAAAALAVDGVGCDTEETGIRHEIDVHVTDPQDYGREVTYALMFCMEYDIALNETRNRELVMLDGAFSTGLIAASKALVPAMDQHDDLYNAFFDRWTSSAMSNVHEVLTSDHIIALPKRSSVNEFARQTRLFNNREIDTNGRSTASLILNDNEYSGPFDFDTRTPLYQPPGTFPRFWQDMQDRFEKLRVVYFKPHSWCHAYRIEMPSSIADNNLRLHETLETVRRQTTNPAMMEPYPLYVADRFAKSLSKGINALLESVRRGVIAGSSDPELAFDMLNAYRSDPIVEVVEE